ncbi:CWF19-like protein 2 [Anabrus simplex]|uniref:CWF19-like protein 2 n=1 Tax=Anabrus simplex TaxID=316456 RepID=UPI0035A397B4
MAYVNFQSSRVKEHAREEKRMARDLLLEKAEADYNKRKQVEERRKERGEDKWILPSVDARLKAEAKEMRREKKKKKKDKKEKKKKKKKRERKSSSSSTSSSSEEEQWVEKKDTAPSSREQKDPDKPSKSATNQTKERDEWMNMPGLFPCVTRDELREKTRTKSEAELKREKEKYMLDNLGQSDRELNPYWKDGGCGLPQTASSSVSLASKNVGDGGANWLRRALERAKQQAADEGRSVEDVAAERWGSLKKLESLIEEAENRTRHQRPNHREQNQYRRRGEFRKPDDNSRSQRSYASSQSSGQRSWRKKDTGSQSRSEEPRRRKSPSPSPASSSSSSDESEPAKEDASAVILTEKELNELGAKLVKAELMGNEKLAAELQMKLDAARAARKNSKQAPPTSSSKQEEETVILTRTDSRGFVRPLEQHAYPEPSGGRRKKQKVETHADGKRVRYFADDDKYSLQEMFQREKLSTVEDQNEAFAKLAAKGIGRPDSEYDMDDVFAERARMKESDGKTQARERDRAIREHKRADRALENCNRCFGSKSTMKHLIVAIGTKTYLCLPPHQSLTTGHCLIVPMFHVPCATQLDEDVWAEMQTFRKALTAMFSKMDEDVVFFETAMYLGRFPHMVLECVPMPKETGDLAPIYFKKAILECEMEWSNNKKVVDLSKKDVRRAIPKGLPYFSVDFGLEGGFAHVIEDEKLFPQNFAQEIIGGMLDLDHSLWRKQRRESFDVQCKKVVEFAKLWKPYDFTQKESSRD